MAKAKPESFVAFSVCQSYTKRKTVCCAAHLKPSRQLLLSRGGANKRITKCKCKEMSKTSTLVSFNSGLHVYLEALCTCVLTRSTTNDVLKGNTIAKDCAVHLISAGFAAISPINTHMRLHTYTQSSPITNISAILTAEKACRRQRCSDYPTAESY